MTDLFGNQSYAYFVTHPDVDFAVLLYAENDAAAFASMKANGIPGHDAGWRFYTNGNNNAISGKRIISLEAYRGLAEGFEDSDVMPEPKTK